MTTLNCSGPTMKPFYITENIRITSFPIMVSQLKQPRKRRQFSSLTSSLVFDSAATIVIMETFQGQKDIFLR